MADREIYKIAVADGGPKIIEGREELKWRRERG